VAVAIGGAIGVVAYPTPLLLALSSPSSSLSLRLQYAVLNNKLIKTF